MIAFVKMVLWYGDAITCTKIKCQLLNQKIKLLHSIVLHLDERIQYYRCAII